jgi:hypothetical protein
MKGSPPPEKGRGTGGGFPNTSMVFGGGESFFKWFNGFRGINVFSMVSKVNPDCPRLVFFSIISAKVYFDSVKSRFFQQYHYCKLISRSCCQCRSSQVDKIVKIKLL